MGQIGQGYPRLVTTSPGRRGNDLALTTTQLLDGLAELERALARHAEWMRDWHLAVIGNQPVRDLDVERDCPFADWYDGPPMRPFIDSPAFIPLGQRLNEMCDEARKLAATARGGARLPAEDYSQFMGTVVEFNALVQRIQHDAWRSIATTDPLTGTRNRNGMIAELEAERERSRRLQQPCVIGMMDVDLFKSVNDTYGHPTGDRVLRAVADAARAGLRPYDTIYRYGGEEFLICLPNTTAEAARVVLDRLRRRIAAALVPAQSEGGAREITVTASFGVAEMDTEALSELSIARADAALCVGKKAGRNRVVLWSDVSAAPRPDSR